MPTTREKFDGIIEEYKFVSSLIPIYRQFQNQSIRFVYMIYAAVIGLIAAAVAGILAVPGDSTSSSQVLEVAKVVGGLLPYFILVVAVNFLMADLRIKRASGFIVERVYPKLDALTSSTDLLRWELSPGVYISKSDRILSSSGFLIITMALPAIILAAWSFYYPPRVANFRWFSGVGLVLLGVTVLKDASVTLFHEIRIPPDQEPSNLLLSVGVVKKLRKIAKTKHLTLDEFLSRLAENKNECGSVKPDA